MDNGAFFLGALFAMFFGTVALSIYICGLFFAGKALGRAADLNKPPVLGITKIAAACWLTSFWPLFADWHPLIRLGVGIVFFVGHAFPLGAGFASTLRLRQENAVRRYRKNVDDWLGEWEGESAVAEWNEGEER